MFPDQHIICYIIFNCFKCSIYCFLFRLLYQLLLPQSDSPPSNEQVSHQWIEQFNQFQTMELFQIVRNKLFIRFHSIEEMFHILESICVTLKYLKDSCSHEYFMEYVKSVFDQFFIPSNNLKLSYVNLLIVARKKELRKNEKQENNQ